MYPNQIDQDDFEVNFEAFPCKQKKEFWDKFWERYWNMDEAGVPSLAKPSHAPEPKKDPSE